MGIVNGKGIEEYYLRNGMPAPDYKPTKQEFFRSPRKPLIFDTAFKTAEGMFKTFSGKKNEDIIAWTSKIYQNAISQERKRLGF